MTDKQYVKCDVERVSNEFDLNQTLSITPLYPYPFMEAALDSKLHCILAYGCYTSSNNSLPFYPHKSFLRTTYIEIVR
jgi:hypothetical protein